jgi:hypothetical protein
MSIMDNLISGPLGFGSAPLSNMLRNIPEEEAAATVDAARLQGIRYFDTAPLLAGYAGEVCFPQPQPPAKDHPWRTMPHHAMTRHVSETTLSARARYAAGTREILAGWFDGRPIRDEYLIVEGGKLAGTGARSSTVGRARKAAAAPRK